VPDELVTIGEAARLLGVAVSTLRYWEERGLVTPIAAGRRPGLVRTPRRTQHRRAPAHRGELTSSRLELAE
jgi:DNA-binding transcriptional MerR regulator